MVCQLCTDGETCPDCEKHPADIHSTPPNTYHGTVTPWGKIDLRTPDQRVTQLEQDVHDLKNKMQALMLKVGI